MGYILKVKDDKGNVIGIPAIQGEKGDKGDTGDKGDKGDTGEQGIRGKSAYEVACDNGYVGTEQDFLYEIGLNPWNVDGNIGPISPSVNIADIIVNGDDEQTLTGQSQISFPMINSGTLYLDFNTKTSVDFNAYDYTVKNKVDIYVNDVLSETHSKTYGYENFDAASERNQTLEERYRNTLNVRIGDVVTVKASVELQPKESALTSHKDIVTFTVADVQLKANIFTTHNYTSLLVEG